MALPLRRLYSVRDDIDRWLQYFGGLPNQSAVLDDHNVQVLRGYAEQLCSFFEPNGFRHALRAARRLQEQARKVSPAEIRRSFDDLWADFLSDCDERHIEIIGAEKTSYYEQGFGHEVGHRFPQATKEIKEAGTCYALGRNTACVFHLMRATEHGVRALAIAAGVDKVNASTPINFATWDELANRIRAVVNDDKVLAGWSRPAKEHFRAFYNGALADFIAFKDECRNRLMHTRSGLYDAREASNWIVKTRLFMERLATKVSETSTTPMLREADWA